VPTAPSSGNATAACWSRFFFSSRRRHTRWPRDWSSDVCSSDLPNPAKALKIAPQTFTDLEKHFDTKLATRYGPNDPIDLLGGTRSEERRVGKEFRFRRSPRY